MNQETAQAGQPTKYREEMVELAKQYLVDYKLDEPVPTIEGLAMYLGEKVKDKNGEKIGLSRESVYTYEKEHPEFFDITRIIRTLQGKELLTGGLLSKFNSIIARLMLAKHGYKESHEIKSSGNFVVDLIKKADGRSDDSANQEPSGESKE